jgi:CheY-like chemotaxis protein
MLTILYVDDDLSGLTGREALLKLQGYNVFISTSGNQGLELFRSLPIDAVILDYQMPEINGDALAARMKQLKPHVPIMLLSAHASLPEDALRRADTFLSKRESPQAFLAAVRDLVESRWSSPDLRPAVWKPPSAA